MTVKVLEGLPEELEERAQKLHKEAIVFDGLLNSASFTEDKYVNDLADGGLTGANVTVAGSTHDFLGAVSSISDFKKLVDNCSTKATLCATVQQLQEAKRQGKVGVVLGFQDTKPIEDNLDYIRIFHDLGVRIIQMTYNMQNWVGSGCCERHDGPLSVFGLEVLEELEYRGILVDLSHCGNATTLDTLKHAKKPCAFTHTGAYALCNAHARNKTDEQIKLLAETGGVMGVTFFPSLVKRNPETYQVLPATVEDVLDQIDHVVKLVGVDHVAFGTDMSFKWIDIGQAPPASVVRDFRTRYPHVFGVGPTDYYEPYPEGLDRHAKLINLTRGLVVRGYKDEDVLKVLGGNWMRLFNDTWKS